MNVTLYIPDSLHQRLEQYRSQINASAVLQRALERELSSLETAQDLGSDEMTTAVQRLLAEKEAMEGRSREQGQSEGLKWALLAPYESLALVAHGYSRNKKRIHGHPIEAAKLLKKACSPATWQSIDKPERSAPMVEKGSFCLGFLDGVLRVWKRLQQETPTSPGV